MVMTDEYYTIYVNIENSKAYVKCVPASKYPTYSTIVTDLIMKNTRNTEVIFKY